MTPAGATAKPIVLIVDDDQGVLEVLHDLVSSLGYATVTVHTGAAGIDVVRADPPPDAVLLDIAMPGALNGVDALRAIRAQRPGLPVIMVTANADEALAKATLQAGAFDYVMKPVEMGRLRELLAAAMTLSGKEPPA
jgi:CheY-like chemotaxis protein